MSKGEYDSPNPPPATAGEMGANEATQYLAGFKRWMKSLEGESDDVKRNAFTRAKVLLIEKLSGL
jgi:hypothetical protein